MAMTVQERATQRYIYQKLREEGYPTYAGIFAKLDLHLTNSPRVIGFMNPKDGSITINRNLDENQFSVIIRHEILHWYLQHERRLLDHLAQQRGIDPDKIDDLSLNELKQYLYGDKTFNIAADYEISNRGYTEEDKDTVRNILLNGETLHGLVTEDEHPEWVNWDVEDMYDALLKEKEKAEQEAQNEMGDSQNQQQSDSSAGEEDDSNYDSSSSSQQSSQQGSDEDSDREPSSSQSQKSKKSGGKSSSSSNQGDGSEEGDDENSEGNQDNDGNSGKGKNTPVVYGRFIDEHTFVDENGNIIKVGD